MYLMNTDTGVVGKVTHRLLDVLVEYAPKGVEASNICMQTFEEIYTPAAFEVLSKMPNMKVVETANEFSVLKNTRYVSLTEDSQLSYSQFEQTITTY